MLPDEAVNIGGTRRLLREAVEKLSRIYVPGKERADAAPHVPKVTAPQAPPPICN